MSARVTVVGSPEDPIRVTKVPEDNLLSYSLEVKTVVPRMQWITICWYDTLQEAVTGYKALMRAVSEGALERRTE